MKLAIQTPKKALKALLKQKPLRSEIDVFKTNLIRLLGKVNEIEREENQKNHIRDFLRDTFYKNTNEINTKDSKDLVIHLGKTNKDKIGVIIEAKRPSNKSEMLSAHKPNTKALHELVLYYLRERIEENNIDIKYCIATNIYEWYIIDASYFETIFARNKSFIKEYQQWRDKQKVTSDTKLFYESIAKPFIDKIQDEIPCIYFDIRDYETVLRN
ncbi:MAG: type II restriction endonuclease, partial [Flavobacterium sp.]|nr:type II restriction endonuclease [Flavobacterium sp.]